MLRHRQGSTWKRLKEKGTSRKRPLDMMQHVEHAGELYFAHV